MGDSIMVEYGKVDSFVTFMINFLAVVSILLLIRVIECVKIYVTK